MHTLNQAEILAYLRENKKLLEERFGVTKIALCGSYARNEAGPDSDIDLLIEANEEDYVNRFFLREHLEQQFNKKVHIGYFTAVRSCIMKNIEPDLIYA